MTISVDTNDERTRSHSRFMACKDVCEKALRKINAYSINDTAADPEHLAESLGWLDMIVAFIVGTNRASWLIGASVPVALDADTASYDLADALGSDLPDGGVLFVTGAYLEDDSGNSTPIRLIKKGEYDAIDDKDASGAPELVYVDRLLQQQICVSPVPADSDVYTLYLEVQTYAVDMTRNKGQAGHGMSPEWQLYLVTELAACIGDGPIRRINSGTLRTWKQEARDMKETLLAFTNGDQPGSTELRRTAAWGR